MISQMKNPIKIAYMISACFENNMGPGKSLNEKGSHDDRSHQIAWNAQCQHWGSCKIQ
jgi:hypothetical protein